MANADSTLSYTGNELLHANDKLCEARALVCFVQSISVNCRADEAVILQPDQLTGLYFVLSNTITRIREAEALIDLAREHPALLA